MPPAAYGGYRARVAAQRRARMRQRLVESAVLLFADRGLEACVIDDVIAHAAVARGSFYNHFRSNTALLAAASRQVAEALHGQVEQRVRAVADPALRLATGLRLFLGLLRRHRLLARFVSRAAADLAEPGLLVRATLPALLQQGVQQGRFQPQRLDVALDLVRGATLVAVARLAEGATVPAAYDRALAERLLQALGLPADEARALAATPLAPLRLPADSLPARCLQRQAQADGG